jgi:signal transduction histidine kinase
VRSRVRDFIGSAPLKLVAVVLFAILMPSVLVTALGLVAVFEAQSFVEDFRRDETGATVGILVQRVSERWQQRVKVYREVFSEAPWQNERLQEFERQDRYVTEILLVGDEAAEDRVVPVRLAPEGRPAELRRLDRLEFQVGNVPEALSAAQQVYYSSNDAGVRVEALLAMARLQFKSGALAAACLSLEEAYKRYGNTVDISGIVRAPALLSRLVDLYAQLDNDLERRASARRLRGAVREYAPYLSAGTRDRYVSQVSFLPALPEEPTASGKLARDPGLPTLRLLRRRGGRVFVHTLRRGNEAFEVVSFSAGGGRVVHLALDHAALEEEAHWVAAQLNLPSHGGLVIAKKTRRDQSDAATPDFRLGMLSPFDHLELRYQPGPGQLPPRFRAFELMSIWTFTWSVVVLVVAIIVGVLVTLRTVLEERRTARLKTDFVSFISHELKTPLTSIRMYAETLLDERITDEGERELCVRMVDRESKRLSSLIDQILQYSQFERHQKEFLFTSCNIEDVVREAVGLFKEHDQTGRLVEINAVQRISKIRMDRAAIIELLLNLIGNAAKYSPASEKIAINLHESIEDICVDVVDHGVGIRKRDQKKIFDKFYRAEDYLTRDVEGTGLGLTFARYIAKVHNGEIKVTSQLNGGSTFTLQLRKTHVLAE